jgi:hypothetical protein
MNELYFPPSVFKNILSYCGDPLPKNEFHSTGFNWKKTKVYYREEGKIRSKVTQLIISCKKCNKKYRDTGYVFCSGCYNIPCVTCGKNKTNPLSNECRTCLDKKKKYTCKCCENKMDKNYLYCYSCKFKQIHQAQDPNDLKYYRCCPCGASLKNQPDYKRVCYNCYKEEKQL